jgi:hypothetical protein
VLKWFVFLLLLFTLGWKLAVRPSDSSELKEKAAQLKLAEFLARQHFTVAVAEKIEGGRPEIRATAGACRMLLASSPAIGSHHDLIARHATAADHVFYVFGGKIYAEQPTWLTVSDFLWARFQRELGLKAEPKSLFAVIATMSCAAERLPWNELG